RGVVHAAGVLDDGLLLHQELARFERVLAPKVAGAWNLHLATRDEPLDFFVLYSSAAALVGAEGQASYVAANSFLDALAHHRRGLGLPAVSIDWGLFAGVGLAAGDQRGAQRGDRLAARGLGTLTPAQGNELVGRLACGPHAQIGVVPLDE